MPQQGYGGTYNDPEQGMDDGDVKGFGFSEESIRKAFIRKVYSILMVSMRDHCAIRDPFLSKINFPFFRYNCS